LKGLGERTNEAVVSVQTLQRAVARTSERVSAGERSLLDVTTSMTRVSTAAREVEGAAVELRSVSARVREGAEAGRVLVGRFAQGVGVMRASVDAVEDTVTSLATRVREIQGIIGVIGDVADQTALLALNASILAAQAGEEGRGFSVVASAIKDLSARTRRSTEQIAALIAEIIDQTEAAAQQSLEGRRAVEDGGRQALDASTAVEAILTESTASSVALEGIAALSTRSSALPAYCRTCAAPLTTRPAPRAGSTRPSSGCAKAPPPSTRPSRSRASRRATRAPRSPRSARSSPPLLRRKAHRKKRSGSCWRASKPSPSPTRARRRRWRRSTRPSSR
jgi:surface antigen